MVQYVLPKASWYFKTTTNKQTFKTKHKLPAYRYIMPSTKMLYNTKRNPSRY